MIVFDHRLQAVPLAGFSSDPLRRWGGAADLQAPLPHGEGARQASPGAPGTRRAGAFRDGAAHVDLAGGPDLRPQEGVPSLRVSAARSGQTEPLGGGRGEVQDWLGLALTLSVPTPSGPGTYARWPFCSTPNLQALQGSG